MQDYKVLILLIQIPKNYVFNIQEFVVKVKACQ